MSAAGQEEGPKPTVQMAAPSSQQTGPSGQPAAASGQQAGPSGQPAASSGQQAAPSGQPDPASNQQAGPSGQPDASSVQQAAPSGQPSHINLRVMGQDGSLVMFRIRRTTHLRNLMNAYCQRQSLNINTVTFLFDGRTVREEQTPGELGMENGDEIDAMLPQNGGGRYSGAA